jgi:hypothetical protein
MPPICPLLSVNHSRPSAHVANIAGATRCRGSECAWWNPELDLDKPKMPPSGRGGRAINPNGARFADPAPASAAPSERAA